MEPIVRIYFFFTRKYGGVVLLRVGGKLDWMKERVAIDSQVVSYCNDLSIRGRGIEKAEKVLESTQLDD